MASAWIGNTERVAQDHYLQRTDPHFEKDIMGAAKNPAQAMQEAAGNGEKLK